MPQSTKQPSSNGDTKQSKFAQAWGQKYTAGPTRHSVDRAKLEENQAPPRMEGSVLFTLDYVGKTRRHTTNPDSVAAAGQWTAGHSSPADSRARQPAARSHASIDGETRGTNDLRQDHEDHRPRKRRRRTLRGRRTGRQAGLEGALNHRTGKQSTRQYKGQRGNRVRFGAWKRRGR